MSRVNTKLYLKFHKKNRSQCSSHTQNDNCEVMDVAISLIVVIILQCVLISKASHCTPYIYTILCFTSVRLKALLKKPSFRHEDDIEILSLDSSVFSTTATIFSLACLFNAWIEVFNKFDSSMFCLQVIS